MAVILSELAGEKVGKITSNICAVERACAIVYAHVYPILDGSLEVASQRGNTVYMLRNLIHSLIGCKLLKAGYCNHILLLKGHCSVGYMLYAQNIGTGQ